MGTCLENSISIIIYADGCTIGSAIIGFQDSLLSKFFGAKVEGSILPGKKLKCVIPEWNETFLLDIEFED